MSKKKIIIVCGIIALASVISLLIFFLGSSQKKEISYQKIQGDVPATQQELKNSAWDNIPQLQSLKKDFESFYTFPLDNIIYNTPYGPDKIIYAKILIMMDIEKKNLTHVPVTYYVFSPSLGHWKMVPYDLLPTQIQNYFNAN